MDQDYVYVPLKHRNKELERIIDNMSDAIFIADKYSKYIKLNKAARDFFGPLERIGDLRKSFTFYDEDGSEIPLTDMTISRVLLGEMITQKSLYMKKDDKVTYFSVSSIPVLDNKGGLLIGIICICGISQITAYTQQAKKHHNVLYNIINLLDLPLVRISYPGNSSKIY